MISYKIQNKFSQSYNVDVIKHSKSQKSMLKKKHDNNANDSDVSK